MGHRSKRTHRRMHAHSCCLIRAASRPCIPTSLSGEANDNSTLPQDVDNLKLPVNQRSPDVELSASFRMVTCSLPEEHLGPVKSRRRIPALPASLDSEAASATNGWHKTRWRDCLPPSSALRPDLIGKFSTDHNKPAVVSPAPGKHGCRCCRHHRTGKGDSLKGRFNPAAGIRRMRQPLGAH